jgi:hypothetical protein
VIYLRLVYRHRVSIRYITLPINNDLYRETVIFQGVRRNKKKIWVNKETSGFLKNFLSEKKPGPSR